MSDWLFAAPLWLPTLLGFAGLLVFIDGNRRMSKPARYVGIALFVLAIVLFTLGRVVDTDQKRVSRQTVALIDGVREGKWDTVSAILEPDTVLTLPGTAVPWYTSASQIVDGAKSATGTYALSGTWIQSMQLTQTGSEMTETLTLRSTFDAYPNAPVPSEWQLDWVKDGQTWRVHEIHPLSLNGQSGSEMEHDLPKK